MPTIGELSFDAPVEPRKGTLPRPKPPPSAATNQAPGAATTPATALSPDPAGPVDVAMEADIPSTLASAVVAATRPTTRRRPRRGRPMVRIFFQFTAHPSGSCPFGWYVLAFIRPAPSICALDTGIAGLNRRGGGGKAKSAFSASAARPPPTPPPPPP